MEHYVLKLYKVYINDNPELTMTYFKTMSNLAKPRYQVSVYRTIGPLVSKFSDILHRKVPTKAAGKNCEDPDQTAPLGAV